MITLIRRKGFLAAVTAICGFVLVTVLAGGCIRLRRPELAPTPPKDFTTAPSPSAKSPPPDFELSDLEGRKVRLTDFKGAVVLLNFWTTSCPWCMKELPTLEKLQNSYGTSLKVLAVNLGDDRSKVGELFKKEGYRFTALVGDRAAVEKIVADYKISAIPVSYVIAKDGSVTSKLIGYQSEEQFKAALLLERGQGS